MLRSPSSLRSLLHLCGRLLRPPNPRLPSSPLSARRPRFLCASPTPGGARCATFDHDRVIERLCASASDTPVEPDIWAIFDPVAGRIVIQRPPPPSPSTTEDEEVKGEGTGETEDEEKAGVKGKGKRKWWASASGEKGQTGRALVTAALKSARKGKGGKNSGLYVCSNCGELYFQWRSNCRYCKAAGTFQKCRDRDMLLQGDGDPSEEEKGEGAGESEGEEKAGVKGNGKGKRKRKKKKNSREGQGNASGEKGQTGRPSVAAVGKSARKGKGGKDSALYVCTNCREVHSQWWGTCRYCNATRTVQKCRDMVLQGDGEEEGEGAESEDEEKAGVKGNEKGNGKGNASVEKGQTGRPSVAAGKSARKGKGSKGCISYVCSNCGEGHSQWWGTCRYCKALGTIQKFRDMVLQGDGDPSEEEEVEGEGAGEREDEEKAGVKENEKGKGKWKRMRDGQGNSSGEKGQTSRLLDGAALKSSGNGGKERVSYVCSHCGEGHRQWWGYCRLCNVPGTLQKSREMVPEEVN